MQQNDTPLSTKKPPSTALIMTKYLLRRVFAILLTIVIGVYITVWISNQTEAVDASVINQIDDQIHWMEYNGYFDDIPEEQLDSDKYKTRLRLQEEIGLLLPAAQRNLRWTLNALTFNWGETVHLVKEVSPGSTRLELFEVRDVILLYFPNTLMLIGVANLIMFAFGIPLALAIASRKRGQFPDRIVTMLSPISSIPSWVHGALLITIFAIQFKVLPASGKYDILPAENWVENAVTVGRHMVLPVSAILLGMFFSLVYSWRTYLTIYTEEDYVELAKSQGIPQASLERNHILRPALPFILTSFAMTLVGFWQMTTALEKFFYWPGIGQLYLHSLPQYFQEEFYPGNMAVLLSVVVIFAYLLGFTVLALDLTYMAVDPRVRLGGSQQMSSAANPKFRRRFSWKRIAMRRNHRQSAKPEERLSLFQWIKTTLHNLRRNLRISLRNGMIGVRRTMREILRYPSAIIGLIIISILVIGSIYAVIAFPYMEIGEEWHRVSLTGKFYTPKNVPAEWVNWFPQNDYPTTIALNSADGSLPKSVQTAENGQKEIIFSAPIAYPYGDFPQDVVLYIDAQYQKKAPHISITWTTPDGREITPKSPAIKSELTYYFSEYIPLRVYLRKNDHWKKWFETAGPNPTPPFYTLFADPEADEPVAVPGSYQLEVSALTFEDDTDVAVEFLLLGQVYGWAGTDYLRRDLLIPLLWGMPFALAFGLIGATLTTILAMIFAAAGVWFGGSVDGLIQRLTEINMIIPILAIGVLIYFLYGVSLWAVMAIVIALNVFGAPTKAFRAAFLQEKEAPYIEAARAYGASNSRIIFTYMIPRIIPTLIPQLVALIPSMVFLEATLSILGVFDPRFPTWGRVIYDALEQKALWGGSYYWVLEPIFLLLLTGLAFALLGFALERVLNPRLQTK